MENIDNIDYDFKTTVKDQSSIYEYLKKYFDADIPEYKYTLNTDDILNLMEIYMKKADFGSYFRKFLINNRFSEINNHISDLNDIEKSTEELISYCYDKFKENGLIDAPSIFSSEKAAANSAILKKSLKKWFANVTPARENIFFLAFALEMNCDELADFLTKGTCDKALNFKSPAEVTAYWCLKNKKPYSYALMLLDTANNTKRNVRIHKSTVFTDAYRNHFEKIKNEKEFIKFLAMLIAENNNPAYSACAKRTFDLLLQEISISAYLDKKISVANETGKDSIQYDKVSYGTVERYIYYYIPSVSDHGHYTMHSFASYNNSGNIIGKSHNSMKKHKWFFSTLLRRSDLKKMHTGERKINRDTILTLAFFVICEKTSELEAAQYISEINEYLSFCRFDEMNFSYPYDLFIYICLLTNDPIGTFRKIWAKSWEK